MALTDVCKLPIRMVYPMVNGDKDLAFVKLNQTFYPGKNFTNLKPSEGQDHMSNTLKHQLGLWTPNHFVPLLPSSSIYSVPDKTSVKPIKTDIMSSTPIDLPIKTEHMSPIDLTNIVLQEGDQSPPGNMVLSGPCPGPSSYPCVDTDQMDFRCDDVSSGVGVNHQEHGLKELPNQNRFLTNEETLDILIKSENPSDRVPNGSKNNVYVLVSNSNDFSDDRGVWDSKTGTTNNTTLSISTENAIKTLFKRNGVFVERKRVQGVTKYTTLDPQPSENILTMHRYYTKHKQDHEYKKRITTIIQAPTHLNITNLAIIEYLGIQTFKRAPHGN